MQTYLLGGGSVRYRAHALSIQLLVVKIRARTQLLHSSLVPPQQPYILQPTHHQYPLRTWQQSPTDIEPMHLVSGFWGWKSAPPLNHCTRASYHLNHLIYLNPHITSTLSACYNSPPPILSPSARYPAFGGENLPPAQSQYPSLVPPQSSCLPQPTHHQYSLHRLQQSPSGIECVRSVSGFWGTKHLSPHSLVPHLHHSPKHFIYYLHKTPHIYWWGPLVMCGEGIGDGWVEVYKVVEVVWDSDTVIERGRGFSPPKDTTRMGSILVRDSCNVRRGYYWSVGWGTCGSGPLLRMAGYSSNLGEALHIKSTRKICGCWCQLMLLAEYYTLK